MSNTQGDKLLSNFTNSGKIFDIPDLKFQEELNRANKQANAEIAARLEQMKAHAEWVYNKPENKCLDEIDELEKFIKENEHKADKSRSQKTIASLKEQNNHHIKELNKKPNRWTLRTQQTTLPSKRVGQVFAQKCHYQY